jgi:hypothetical protein
MKQELSDYEKYKRACYYEEEIEKAKINGEQDFLKKIIEKYRKFVVNNFESIEIYKKWVNDIQNNNIPQKPKDKFRKNILRRFKSAYADLKMSYLPEEEFMAMKYYEKLIYNKKFQKEGITLKHKKEEVCKKYNIDIIKLNSIWASRCKHIGYANNLIKENQPKKR